jgi:hypothetical protein
VLHPRALSRLVDCGIALSMPVIEKMRWMLRLERASREPVSAACNGRPRRQRSGTGPSTFFACPGLGRTRHRWKGVVCEMTR